MIRGPLCLLDMDVAVDGADAFIITTAERARDLRLPPVLVNAIVLGMIDKNEEDQSPSLRQHGQQVTVEALKAKSDFWIDDIDLFFRYDGFSVIALNWFENVGYCGPGEAGSFIEDSWAAGEDGTGRILWSYRAGTVSTVADGFAYCNGIAADRDGSLVVVEALGLQRPGPDGSREPIIEKVSEGAADGVCLDVDGRIYAAVNPDRAVKVIEDGRVVECLAVPGDDLGVLTNCCFGGPDGRTLFVNDAFHGRVLAWESMPSPGLPLHPWPVPPA